MSQQVRASFGVTLPSSTDYASRRVDLELTLDIKKGETPQAAMGRATKEVMSFMKSAKTRRPLTDLERVISDY